MYPQEPGRKIVVFTLHKSASMFIHRQCAQLCSLGGISYHSPNIPGSGLDARRLLTDVHVWQSLEGCVAPVRFFVDVPQLQNYDVILHLRDPRDVLVSMFYSYCFIHAGEVAAGTGYRQEVASRGIDAFVLAKATEDGTRYPGDYGTGGHLEDLIGNLPRRYDEYLAHLVGKPNVVLVKYEQLVTDYRGWLEQFMRPFPLQQKAALLEQLASQAGRLFPERKVDVLDHVRHVAPGDHRTKLKTATINRLNDIFAVTLDTLGYAA